MMLAVIRIRGSVNTRKEINDTLKMLRLPYVNNCVLAEDKPEIKGMIEKCKDYVTFGEIDKETLVKMLEKRLRLKSDRRIDEKALKEITGFSSYEEFADMLIQGSVRLTGFKVLQPNFRLTPPSKGFKSINQHYPKGDIGNRGKKVNSLIESMI